MNTLLSNTYIQNAIRMAGAIHPAQWVAMACLVSLLYLSVLPVATGYSSAEEYLCLAIPVIAIAGIIIALRRKIRVKMSLVDWLATGWYLYAMGRLWLDATYPAFGFALRATLMLLLYSSLRILFSSVRIKGSAIVILLIVFALVEAGMGYSQLLSGSSRHYLYPVTGSFLNPGPYSAYLALGLTLLIAFRKRLAAAGETSPEIIWFGVLLALGIPLVLTMSRAAFLGVGVSLLLIYRKRIRGWRQWGLLAAGALALAVMLYAFKSGSADGRGVINYIGIKSIAGNPWTGSGIGSFFHRYAEETAALSRTDMSESLMKVDVIDYAFNDLLYVAVEQGIAGLAFALSLISAVLVRLWKECRALSLGAMTLLVISLVSYPFELLPYQIVAVVLAAYSGASKSRTSTGNPDYSRFHSILRYAPLLAVIVAVSSGCLHSIKERRDAEKDYNLFAGIQDKAFIKDYHELLPYLHDNKRFLFDFGRLLSRQGRYNDSNEMLRRGALISNDPMFLVLQGNNYRDMGAFDEAERLYLNAWHMMPNRIYPLYRLMLLHHQAADSCKSIEYAKKVAAFKEKISSPAVNDMKREAREIIRHYNNSDR